MATNNPLSSIEEAIHDFKAGKFVIVVDDEDRENEGDLIMAAELATPETVNFMLRHGRGVLCAPITNERCRQLDLEHQVQTNTSMLGTPFTVTIDLLEGCTTGVSCHDRAATIRALADPERKPTDFGRPGHINPLYAQDRGVLARAGHTEAAIDLARLAGMQPAACSGRASGWSLRNFSSSPRAWPSCARPGRSCRPSRMRRTACRAFMPRCPSV